MFDKTFKGYQTQFTFDSSSIVANISYVTGFRPTPLSEVARWAGPSAIYN
jgi:hypothetical protein